MWLLPKHVCHFGPFRICIVSNVFMRLPMPAAIHSLAWVKLIPAMQHRWTWTFFCNQHLACQFHTQAKWHQLLKLIKLKCVFKLILLHLISTLSPRKCVYIQLIYFYQLCVVWKCNWCLYYIFCCIFEPQGLLKKVFSRSR